MLHLARHVLRTSAHKLLIPGQEVYRYPLRMAVLPLRLRPELLQSGCATGSGAHISSSAEIMKCCHRGPRGTTQPRDIFQILEVAAGVHDKVTAELHSTVRGMNPPGQPRTAGRCPPS